MTQRGFLLRGIEGLSITDLRVRASFLLRSFPLFPAGLGAFLLLSRLLLGHGSRSRFQLFVFLACLGALGRASHRGPVLADLDDPIILGDLQADLGIIGLCRCLGCRLFPSIPIGFSGFSGSGFLLGCRLRRSLCGHRIRPPSWRLSSSWPFQAGSGC